MNKKEIAELRRRLNPDKSNISLIRGCYVDNKKEILSEFSDSLMTMPQEEGEKYLGLLRRTLSGEPGKNLIDLSFRTRDVTDGEEHRLLSDLRATALKDDEKVHTFFQKIASSYESDDNYLILLAYDVYDIFQKGKDGADSEESGRQFPYLLCAVCPVRLTKEVMSYRGEEKRFRYRSCDWVLATPQLGFLFPAFDDRKANIYGALYYTRDAAGEYPTFTDAVFKTDVPFSAAKQKELFHVVLADSLKDDCNFDVMQNVNLHLADRIEEHEADKRDPDVLAISKTEIKSVLTESGVSETHVEEFDKQYDQTFGVGTDINPKNIVDRHQMELRTGDIVVRVSTENSELVETRVIDGTRYVMIRADAGVELNGINVSIPDPEKK